MKITLHYSLLILLLLLTTNTIVAQDTDGDGVANTIDLDSDNDGILDIVECPEKILFEFDLSTFISSSLTERTSCAGGDFGGIWFDTAPVYSIGAPNHNCFDPSPTTATITDHTTGSSTSGTILGIQAGPGNDFLSVINFNQSVIPNTEYQFSMAYMIWARSDFPTVDFRGAIQVYINGTLNQTYTGGAGLDFGIWENSTIDINSGASTTIDIDIRIKRGLTTSGNDYLLDDIFLKIKPGQLCDTDMDGTPDYLDLDSDNDGCNDVAESGGIDTNNDGVLDGTGFDTNGRVTGGSGGYNGVTGYEVVATQMSFISAPLASYTLYSATSRAISGNFRIKETTKFNAGVPDYSGVFDSALGFNYQWYLGDPNAGGLPLSDSSPNYSGTTTRRLLFNDIPTSFDGNEYYLVVNNTRYICFSETYSTIITVIDSCDSVASGNPDYDNDGVSDICDLDDDNDGIIDTFECSATISFDAPSLLTASDLDNVQIGEKVLYSNALFFQGQYYDFVLTVLNKVGSFDVQCNGNINMSNTQPTSDSHVTYSLDLVVSGTATPSNPTGESAVLYDLILQLRDNDSIINRDFTEINGFNPSTATGTVTPYLSATTELEQGGFVNGPDPVGYSLYRVDPTLRGDINNWRDEEGSSEDDMEHWVYLEFDIFSHIDLIFGTTGSYPSTDSRLTQFGVESVCDSDDDGILNTFDIDSDNDGIPDNVEAQTTLGYQPPSGTIDPVTGIYTNYSIGIIPVDTDGDGLIDMYDSDTDNDGTPDIEENGMANAIINSDTDNDGLDDVFETTNINDTNLDVNEDIENPSDLSILPDVDFDLTLGGDLDYRDLFDINPPTYALIDFDGIDDYLSTDTFIAGLSSVTIMAWVKTDSGNSTDMVIAGENSSCKLWLQNGRRPSITMNTVGSGASTVTLTSSSINYDEWHHITASYSGITGDVALYIDGRLVRSSNVGEAGAVIKTSQESNGNFEVGRLSTKEVANHLYFKGDIDEVRVFDVSLTSSQIQQLVYQEIEEGSSLVQGVVIPTPIVDTSSSLTIPWSNLIAYYPMTNILSGKTTDYSSYNKDLFINFITSIQEETAPMPYETSSNGNWTLENTWLHGNVWDIENISSLTDYGIVKISGDITVNDDIEQLGLIIDSGSKLTVSGDHLVKNNLYLELNGTLDLEDDSQLLQTQTSNLVTSINGKILRRQEGTPSAYWYNYWSSPVGSQSSTSFLNNNSTTNNPNNTPFTVNMLKDSSGSNVSFTSNYTANNNISTYWLYTYINGLTYYDWTQIAANVNLIPGVGYTQKGTGIGGSEQQYIFEGKPNNGTILVAVEDIGGAGSVAGSSKTEFLLGNPYPSAIDVHKFIDDNAGIIDGTLQLWQQWSGTSHNLNAYNGGYAQINKTGAVRASQFVGLEGVTTGGLEGTKVPTRYLPVGQGFITEIVATGSVEFNNSQRIFVKEADANGSYENGSVFFKGNNNKGKSTASNSTEVKTDVMQRIRLEFSSVTGPDTKRELLLGFSPQTTDSYDYGYDAETHDISNN
ncbi:LamG-like jellyroll fold domain-containing protein, partial [Hyunsoonleella sp. 2307UL5-6]|uniref:LamG domain-containing protein n=1 Tax=Hyunsoonleella sp. 2307UL5-6 TaxID=3384768 RepID=UPI0039BC60A9